MIEPLHEHNQKTYENICRMYGEGIQRVAVVQPTGSGKSLLMAKLIEDNPDSRFFVLSTRHEINNQFKEQLDQEMLERSEFNIYCNMSNMKKEVMELLQPDYIFLDEMHRALAKEWSKGIKVLLEMYPNAKVLGLSATPIRYLDKCRNVAEELFSGNLACDMSLSQAILDGILPMARYVCGVYSYEKDAESLNKKIERSTNSPEEKKELLQQVKVLKDNLDKGNGVSDIFRKYVSGNEKFVVFLKNIKHLARMKPIIKKWFINAGFSSVRMYEVHCKNLDRDKEFQAFKDDTQDGIKLCLSINIVAEGIHGDINGVIMLRDTISANMYFQMIGRAFSCGKKTIPLIFDLVANSQFISNAADISFPNELRGEIEKRKNECKKENKDYEVGFDVDEFIVMDQFMDVVSGFKEIEERLEGNWDLYIRALTQYKEREGDCDVPQKHVEIVDGTKLNLGWWISRIRSSKDIQGSCLLTEERESQLNEMNFIWNVLKYNFENNIKCIAEYYRNFGIYPSSTAKDKEIINKYLSDFSCETRSEKSFNDFIYYIKIYKKRYGHVDNIKKSDIIDGYKIGEKKRDLKKYCKSLSNDQIKELENLGLYLGDEIKRRFDNLLELSREVIDEGVIISHKNPKYKNKNLYDWVCGTVKRRYKKGELSLAEIQIIEKMIGKSLDNFYCENNPVKVKVLDVIENREIGIFESKKQTSKVMQEKFNVKASNPAIENRLKGKITTPYKGRFMFYYADKNKKVTE